MRLTLALGLALLLASPAVADELIASYHGGGGFWYGSPEDVVGGSIHVEAGEALNGPTAWLQFNFPALQVGEVSRVNGIDLSGLMEHQVFEWRTYLFGIGYDDGGFHPLIRDFPVAAPPTNADFKRMTAYEFEFTRRDYEVELDDIDTYYRVYVEFEVRALVASPTPEPGTAALLLIGLCFVHRRSLRR